MTEHKQDMTFSRHSKFGSKLWTATTLGRSVDWFFRHRGDLESKSFPKEDAITGQYLKADVEAWINRRRKLSDAVNIGPVESPKLEVNLDGL